MGPFVIIEEGTRKDKRMFGKFCLWVFICGRCKRICNRLIECFDNLVGFNDAAVSRNGVKWIGLYAELWVVVIRMLPETMLILSKYLLKVLLNTFFCPRFYSLQFQMFITKYISGERGIFIYNAFSFFVIEFRF